MSPIAQELLEIVADWPEEDQRELAAVAREIAARRTGVYHATADELAGIDRGLADVAAGRIASDAEVEAVFHDFDRE